MATLKEMAEGIIGIAGYALGCFTSSILTALALYLLLRACR